MSFLVQILACLIVWWLVDDSVQRGFYNDEFYEWLAFSGIAAALLVALVGVTTKRWRMTLAVAVGCLLAVVSGFLVFGAYAGVHSA